MYGFKKMNLQKYQIKDLEYLLKLEVPHISIYSLIIEDNTILKINNYQRLDDDNDQVLYKYIEKVRRKITIIIMKYLIMLKMVIYQDIIQFTGIMMNTMDLVYLQLVIIII